MIATLIASAPGSGNSPMMLAARQRRRPGKRLARQYPGSAAARRDRPPAGRCSRPRCLAVQRSKNRRSAASWSSATTMSSWRQLRRDKVQRSRLAASNPRSSASSASTRRIAVPPTPRRSIPTSMTIIRTIQPISASHRRCQASHTTPEKGGPDMKAVANEGEAVGRRKSALFGHRGMNCVDRHRTLRRERSISRRADPWWMAPRPRPADRSRPPPAAPSPDP